MQGTMERWIGWSVRCDGEVGGGGEWVSASCNGVHGEVGVMKSKRGSEEAKCNGEM